ncbi:Thiol-disulfide isomerase or thioredoxin [Rubritalea squalenifaciens DSM 18772]|uniref:Thiol-disulfide isomerase or thioredoxin n=1 Tax=Rubritalea squalenifaciens DSM 18772 TaxID=1123071 RepID=A0A1M6BD31_9BACT|nr:TlpA disulfide reductase family protein [Rubritalea squalenifaciens]SHI46625.1 Thiol-disulfide isomerase or thioredoxin [Rubritalea squalenifaciens DSM 18772]
MRKSYKTTAAFCLSLAFGFAAQNLIAADTDKDTAAKSEKKDSSKLSIGDQVPALEGVTWVQGEEIKSFDEKGKVYIVECWATWCGPCVAAIPHVNDLHKKYQDKGLVVLGMNVWEDGLDKVEGFVDKKKDVMTYTVAYSGGKGSNFEKTWLKPAGVRGIPHAFIVKDGKLILMSHPAQINEELIDSIMDGSFDPVAHAKQKAEEEAKAKAERAKINNFKKQQDWDGMIAYANDMEDDSVSKGIYLTQANVQKGDWAALLKLRGEANEKFDRFKPMHIDSQAVMMMDAGEGSKEYAAAALSDMKEIDPKDPRAVSDYMNKARLQFLAGDAEGAKTTLGSAKEALENTKDPRATNYYTKILDAADKALAEGNYPSTKELMSKMGR